MFRLFTALFLLVAASVGAHAQSFPVPSYWKDQRGAEMKFYKIDAQGKLTGVYTNPDAGACRNAPFPLTGRVRGAHIHLVVVWANGVLNCKTRTLWSGQVVGKTIDTKWAIIGTGLPLPVTGLDIFHQQP